MRTKNKTATTTVTLAIGMRVEDLSSDDSVRGTVIAMGKRYVTIKTDAGDCEAERIIDGLDNVGIIPTEAGCQKSDKAAEAPLGNEDSQPIGDGFPTDARRTVGAALRIMDALVQVRYLADSTNECADEKAWEPIVPKLLDAFRMAWDAARADVEMYNFD